MVNVRRYFALDRPADTDNMTSRNCHLEDSAVLDILVLWQQGHISETKLRSSYPQTINAKGTIHPVRRPFDRLGVLQGANGEWYTAVVHDHYLLLSSGQLEQMHDICDIRATGETPWIDRSQCKSQKDRESSSYVALIVSYVVGRSRSRFRVRSSALCKT